MAPQRNRTRIIFRWVKVVILLYCSTGIIFYYLQDKLLLHPQALPNNYVYHFNHPFNEINIDINKNETINMIQFLPKSPRRGVLLYFHGNMQNINHYAARADLFTSYGYEVWMPDYPGFGKSRGNLTEAKLYNLAHIIYKLARSKIGQDSIIVYGRSFGTGIAAELGSQYKCKLLVLETPYFSIPDLAATYAPIYPMESMCMLKLPTYLYLRSVSAPVIIFHGTDDGLIPYRSASKLKKELKAGDKFVTILNGTHNDLPNFTLYRNTVDSLLR